MILFDSLNGEGEKKPVLAGLGMSRQSKILAARVAFLRLLLQRGVGAEGAVELVRDVLPTAMIDRKPHWFGCVARELVKAGIVAPVRYEFSCRKEAHQRPVTIWRLVNESAARDYLASVGA